MNTPSTRKPELLAPAGSIESFHAAIEGGADAVYLGLTDFNARLRAGNFTMKTLSYCVPYARNRSVKLYVTLNTALKQADIEPVVSVLYQLAQIGVDALIVTDIGLIDIARRHFPDLALHASTQMTIHNSAGVMTARNLGLRRVILSRELTLDEIASIKAATDVELEIFVHGALCYSISGLCLASSFMGGSSGNRGRCTQVCRRKFSDGGRAGYFFSPGDLCAIGFLPRITALGINSLKIEGRMKGPEYVYTVVKAWRTALDDIETIGDAGQILENDLGRRKTTFFLNGSLQSGTIDPDGQPGIGLLVGTIRELRDEGIVVESPVTLSVNDRIRIQPVDGFEGVASCISRIESNNRQITAFLKQPVKCSAGDTVYLIGRQGSKGRFDQTRVHGVSPVPFRENCPASRKIIAPYRGNASVSSAVTRDTLWIKIDNIQWLDLLSATSCQRLLLGADRSATEDLLRDSKLLRVWKSRLVPTLPPFIPEAELGVWNGLIGQSKKAGISAWCCSSVGQRALFENGPTLIAGARFWCCNRAFQLSLKAMGFAHFTYSPEDDYLNIKASASPDGIAPLFSRVPLFISRIPPAVRTGATVTDPHGNRFFTARAHGLHYLIAEEPFCLTHRRQKLSALGIRNFLFDLSFCAVDQGLLYSLVDSYKNGTRLPGSGIFNFKAGLK